MLQMRVPGVNCMRPSRYFLQEPSDSSFLYLFLTPHRHAPAGAGIAPYQRPGTLKPFCGFTPPVIRIIMLPYPLPDIRC